MFAPLFVLSVISLPDAAASTANKLPPGDRKMIAPGVYMPRISCGHPDDGEKNATAATLDWLLAGGYGVDTAMSYHNQDQVGAAIRASGLPRADVFVTTKVPCEGGAGTVASNIREDLKELKLEYVDLLLIHFPCKRRVDTQAAWRALQAAHAAGVVKAIGVSNFVTADLDAVLALNGTAPVINQCQASVGSHDDVTINKTIALGATYEAYSPLRHVDLSDPTLKGIASAHNVSTAQVALKWLYQQGVLIATSPGEDREYIQEDLALPTFQLTAAEMETLREM